MARRLALSADNGRNQSATLTLTAVDALREQLFRVGGRRPPAGLDDFSHRAVISVIRALNVPEEAMQRLPSNAPISKPLQSKQHKQMVSHDDQSRIGAELMQRRTHGRI